MTRMHDYPQIDAAIEKAIDDLKADDFEYKIPFAVRRRILQEYGESLRKIASPSSTSAIRMATYIAPPYAWVIPSWDGDDGVFFRDLGGASADYAGVRFYKPEGYLSDWCNISAYMDGCEAYSHFLNFAMRQQQE